MEYRRCRAEENIHNRVNLRKAKCYPQGDASQSYGWGKKKEKSIKTSQTNS